MNIGCVIYKKNFLTGEIDAHWSFDNGTEMMAGTGYATGPVTDNYSGNYRITYFDSKKNNMGDFLLTISEQKDSYILKWYQEDLLKFSGVAMLSDNVLSGGWKPV